ncbi:hypothetical protein E4T56_gene20065 [Termitomyces sp. T112]|nr:hypothetical protein E4T56_gene20065 [Termitomyces sp. T112]KAH0588875.1 hypothetical protein H2248_004665 [Termitomyces sp. 'cryptogamus']
MLICRVGHTHTARHRVSWFIYRSLSHATNSKTLPQRHEILTLLHKTTSLLPRALPPEEQAANSTESPKLWKEILSKTYTDLVSKEIPPVHITVYGLDQWSGAQDLVTALLEEPLTSDQSLNERIRSRWGTHPGQTTLRLSSANITPSLSRSKQNCSRSLPANKDSEFHVSSSFFQQFPFPLQIVELSPSIIQRSRNSVSSVVVTPETYDALLEADVSVILCNPLTTPISVLLRDPCLFRNPNTILVVTSTPPKSNLEDLRTNLSEILPEKTARRLKIYFVDPFRAVAANEVLKSDFQSPIAIQRYQDDYNGSQVSSVLDAFKEIISPKAEFSESSLRYQTALARIRAALTTYQAALHRVRHETDSVAVDVCALKARLEEAKVKAQGEVLSRFSDGEGDAVTAALDLAAKEIRVVMDRLTWWKMIWRVDEISLLITQAVLQPGCRTLEQQLVLQTGRLSVLQDEITKSMFSLLAAHPHPPFNSAILQNLLQQLVASPSFRVMPRTLIHPIDMRRGQIIEHPTTRLHLTAQRVTLRIGGGIAAGAGLGWAGWLGWLAGTGEGLLGVVGLDAGTAMSLGLLIAVMSVRWGVGKWERAKRRWWEDWDRVGNGLARDLRTTLDQAMQNKVLVVAETGCEKLSEITAQRRSEIEEVEEELDTLQATLDHLDQSLQ